MADAKKCDRCGSYFDKKVEDGFEIKPYNMDWCAKYIELCEDCTNKLKNFLQGSDETFKEKNKKVKPIQVTPYTNHDGCDYKCPNCGRIFNGYMALRKCDKCGVYFDKY